MRIRKIFACIALFWSSIGYLPAQNQEIDWQSDTMPYEAFDKLPSVHIPISNSSLIDVAFVPNQYNLPKDMIIRWITERAHMVAGYYGQFPIKHLRLLVIPAEANGIRHGVTYGYQGGAIKIQIGSSIDQATLDKDWVLVHEMTHLAFPSQRRTQHWIEEGIATYVEPIARAQYGKMSDEEVWRQLIEGLPKGLPAEGDQGLDHTHTWGRTYWGGALFCLLAEIEIRNRTHNKYGLQHALSAINHAGGTIEENWSLEKTLHTGDSAIGVSVLINLYEKMKATPIKPDLENLWGKLGIKTKNNKVEFDNNAQLAAIRKAITLPLKR